MSDTKLNPMLKLGLELGPIVLFFAGFRFFKDRSFHILGTDYSGFIVMTAIFVAMIIASTALVWKLTGTLSKMQLMTLVLVVVMGGLGSSAGAFFAAILIGCVHAFGIHFFPQATLVLVFLTMALVLALRSKKTATKTCAARQQQWGHIVTILNCSSMGCLPALKHRKANNARSPWLYD